MTRASPALSAQQFSPKTAMRQRNGVLIVVPKRAGGAVLEFDQRCGGIARRQPEARALESALIRFIGPTRSRKQSST